LRPIPTLEDQVSVFMSRSDRLAQLHPQAPGSLFVAFYDSQDYGGSILTRLHAGPALYQFHIIDHLILGQNASELRSRTKEQTKKNYHGYVNF
jgi:hypothetical protein